MTKKNEALVRAGTQAVAHKELTNDQIALIKNTIAVGCTDDELSLFVQVCQRTGLDPFARQIYAIKRLDSNGEGGGEKMVIAVSIDGLRLQGQRSNQLNGQEGPFWCGEDGVWKDCWLSKTPPAAAKVVVHRRDCQYPFTGIALWSAYAQKTYGMECPQCKKTGTVLKSKQGDGYFCWAKKGGCGATFGAAPGKMVETYMARWGIDGAGMLGKCAEALANRKAFPAELSGLYTTEELGNVVDVTATVVTEPVPEQKQLSEAKPEVVTPEVLPPVVAAPAPAKAPVKPVAAKKPAVATPVAPVAKAPAVEAVKAALGGQVIAPPAVKTPVAVAPAPVAQTAPPVADAAEEVDNTPPMEEATKGAVLATFGRFKLEQKDLEFFLNKPIAQWTMKDKATLLERFQVLHRRPDLAANLKAPK